MVKGPEWEHVTILEHKLKQPKVQCKYCAHDFVGGAARIRQHFLHSKPNIGVRRCTSPLDEIEGETGHFWAFWASQGQILEGTLKVREPHF